MSALIIVLAIITVVLYFAGDVLWESGYDWGKAITFLSYLGVVAVIFAVIAAMLGVK